jgi:hypothetical protein
MVFALATVVEETRAMVFAVATTVEKSFTMVCGVQTGVEGKNTMVVAAETAVEESKTGFHERKTALFFPGSGMFFLDTAVFIPLTGVRAGVMGTCIALSAVRNTGRVVETIKTGACVIKTGRAGAEIAMYAGFHPQHICKEPVDRCAITVRRRRASASALAIGVYFRPLHGLSSMPEGVIRWLPLVASLLPKGEGKI